MMHIFQNVIEPTFLALVVFCIAYVLGVLTFKTFGWDRLKGVSVLGAGLQAIVGYGVLGTIVLLLSLLGPITLGTAVMLVIVLLLVGRTHTVSLLRQWKSLLRAQKKEHWFNKLLLALILLGVIFYATSAFVPAYRNDAISYHIPEVVEIATQGFSLEARPGQFFFNIFILMETMYVLGYVFGGGTVAHLMHFGLALSFLAVLFSFTSHVYSKRAGLCASLFALSLYEFWVNATNSYVDAATSAFEITAVCLLVFWVMHKEHRLLQSIGLLLGFAAASKYNGLYGVLLFGLIFLFTFIREKISMKEFMRRTLYVYILFLVCAGN